jgi:uncharacterized membrane protein
VVKSLRTQKDRAKEAHPLNDHNDERSSGQRAAVAIYNTHTEAEAAIRRLQGAGIDLARLSVVGKDYRPEDHVVGYYKTGERVKYWGKLGAFWAGVWSLLVGEAFFWMPEVGPIMVGGPLVSSIVGALEGAVVESGMSALGSGLRSLGVSRTSVSNYECALKANKFLLIVSGSHGEAARATEFLGATKPIELATHGA